MKELFDKFNQMKQELTMVVHDNFGKQFKDIFARLPTEITSIGYPQYTPYFNDGSSCRFSPNAYPDSLYLNGSNDWSYEKENPMSDVAKQHENVLGDFCDIVNSIPEEILEEAIGEGLVTIFRDGSVNLEEYEHD